MVKNISFPKSKYKIKETLGKDWPYALYWKIPILPIYHPIDSCRTLKNAIELKQGYIQRDEEYRQKKLKMKQKRWVSEEEQFAEIL